MTHPYPDMTEVLIRSTGEQGIVIGHSFLGDGQRLHYKVHVTPMRKPNVVADDVLPLHDRQEGLLEKVQQGQYKPWQRVSADLTLQKLQNPLTDLLYSFLSSRTEFMPHQFIPMVKLLNSPDQRLLIADEVGLGKTIESGLVLTELRSRGEFKRCLVVCQGHLLMRKWQQEMQTRFDERFELVDRTRLLNFIQEYEDDQDPHLKGICSLPLLKQEDLRERLATAAVPFDLVVVDEAHRLRNPSTLNFELGQVLGGLATVMLFLTATPLQIGNEDLYHLLHLLAPGDFSNFPQFRDLIAPNQHLNLAMRLVQSATSFEPSEVLEKLEAMKRSDYFGRFREDPVFHRVQQQLRAQQSWDAAARVQLEQQLVRLNPLSYIFTRTRRRETTVKFADRSAVRIPVTLTPPEREFLEKLEELAEAIHQESSFQLGASFGVQMLRRHAASCLLGTALYLRDILRRTNDELEDVEGWDDEESQPTNFSLPASCEELARKALQMGQSLGQTDSKFDAFVDRLRKQEQAGGGKALVFSFFKRTLRHLAHRMKQQGFVTYVLSGDLGYEDREQVVEAFRNHEGMAILLSSEVGGEGLDFQFADTMFNYDLPWNPMVVEQRIGRIDRFGQKSDRVWIFNLSVEGTIEERIFERLYDRIQIFERSIGDLEAILGDEIGELRQDILHYRLTPEEEARRVDEIARAIQRREHELEKLEKEAARFSGNNGVFMRQVQEVRTGKKYLQERDLVGLVRTFLEERVHGAALEPSDRGTYVLRNAREFCEVVRHLGLASENQACRHFLALLCGSHTVQLAFSTQVANSDRRYEFVTPRHPLIRLILESYRLQAPVGGAAPASIYVEDDRMPLGQYLVSVFLVHVKSFKEDIALQYVPVDLATGGVSTQVAEYLESALSSAAVQDRLPSPDGEAWDSQVEAAARQAESHVSDVLEERRQGLLEENSRMIDLRIQSLRQTWKATDDRLAEFLRRDYKANIKRMKERERENTRDRFQRQCSKLEEKRTATYEYDLTGMFVLRVGRSNGKTRVPP